MFTGFGSRSAAHLLESQDGIVVMSVVLYSLTAWVRILSLLLLTGYVSLGNGSSVSFSAR